MHGLNKKLIVHDEQGKLNQPIKLLQGDFKKLIVHGKLGRLVPQLRLMHTIMINFWSL